MPPTAHARHPRLSRVLSATISAATVLLLTLGLLALAEGALRYAGYGYPTARFIEDDTVSPAVWRDNQAFVRRFFPGPWYPDTAPTQIPVSPPANSLRVAVLGESAAYGYPDPAFGFGRMLEALLQEEYPDRAVSLINAATSGVSSPCLLETLRDVLRMDPDVLVFYIGNNEFIGPFGASNAGTSGEMSAARIHANVLASRLRLSQWLGALAGRFAAVPAASPGSFVPRPVATGDPAVPSTHARFETNLRAMLDLAAAAKVPVVLCTVAVNLRDWPPVGDTHRADISSSERATWDAAFAEGKSAYERGDAPAALRAWKRAEAIDSEPASLAYLMARAYETTGDTAAAADAFARACTQDAIRYRCSPAMNERIKSLATERADAQVKLADCAAQVARDLDENEAQARYFYDSCHLTFEGNRSIANCIHEQLLTLLPKPPAPAQSAPGALAKRLGWNAWHARENLRYVQALTDKAPYNERYGHDVWAATLRADMEALDAAAAPEALRPARAEMEAECARHPDDLFLARNVAQLIDAEGDHHAAAGRLDALVAMYSRYAEAWTLLARARRAAGEFPQAAAAWRAAYALRPDRTDWRTSLGETLFAGADYPAARAEWRDIARQNPTSEQAWWRLGGTYEREKNFAAAIAVYREGLTHLPGNAGLYYYLVKACMAQGDTGQAQRALAEGLAFSPEHDGLRSLASTLGMPEGGTR